MRTEIIGDATLMLGDCREIIDGVPEYDAIITDPPYSISVSGSRNVSPNGTRNLDFFAGDSDWASMNILVGASIAAAAARLPKSAVIWCSHRQVGFINATLEARGYSTRILCWRKKCPPPSTPGAGFSSAIELAVYGYLPGRFYGGGQYAPNIFECDNYRHGQPGKVDHPTQKPLDLIQWNVQSTTAPGSVVFDFFMGSGTTGVACARMGRKFIGIEIEEKYFSIACRRIEAASRQSDLFVVRAEPKPQTLDMFA